MDTLITIEVETKSWTEGNHAWFDTKLKPNSFIEVHWGDGKKSNMHTYNESSWCRVAFIMRNQKVRNIGIQYLLQEMILLHCLPLLMEHGK